jgi:two-component system, cell cycle response regulator
MKVTDLDPDMLDKCVAHALALDRDLLETTPFKPSTDWNDGGPIIVGAGISFLSPRVSPCEDWQAGMGHPDLGQGWGPTPLIAAMRCYLAWKYGDEVPAPEEWDGTRESANGLAGLADSELQSVLVIDDSQDIHDLIEVELRPEAVRIYHALDANAALASVRRDRPDLLLLDLELPGQGGLELCRQLKADPDLSAIPVIFLTVTVDVAVKVQAFEAGATDYVTKPVDVVELRARVRAALRTKRYQDLLATRARFDGLTGLWNRDYFDRRLEGEALLALGHGWPLSLILLDLDHFKGLNDHYGHPFGDLVLRRVADTLRSTLRRGEIVCRYGGEEFGIILREANIAQAEMTAERVRTQIAGLELVNGTEQVRITASLGVGSSELLQEPQRFSPAALFAAADEALNAAKRAGRNRICRAG